MKRHTILIVDDQSINRRILTRLLQSDYQILEAENGEAALRVLREHSDISVVLLDIVMPVLDGYGVLSALREDPVLSKIPVIVSSQKDGDEAELRALTLGANDFVSKPYKGDIIRHRIENTIRLCETAAIANQAEKDELTGLMSKSFFMLRVEEQLHQDSDTLYDMLCFDVERFKLVNDTCGVETGDRLLRFIASVLDEVPEALYTSRFNADHFYQLYPRDTSDKTEKFHHLLEKLRSFPIEMQLNLHCGVYHIEPGDTSVTSMCDRAKLAADINRAHMDEPYSLYDDSIRQKLLQEQFVIGSMNAGIDEHQFQVYYQPKYNLHTEMIGGAEALVRWIHPEKGFMSPGEFIPIFEKNGFITRLDRYVWEETCKDIRSWLDAGLPPVSVSVNVSRADIFNPHLPEILTGLIQKHNIPISLLHLEITESAYTDNPRQIIDVVSRLHRSGFVIEMDDFGSGYSSLNMLAELPVDVLKLDMGFVQAETHHSSGRGIISFVISLAKWMKLSVVAEGVETAEQIESLRSMDCTLVQGYYYARPMPKADFEKILRTVAVAAQAIPAPAPPQDDTEATSDQADKRILLIVDDIPLNRAVLSNIFCGEYQIVEAGNGREAMEYLHRHGPEVEAILMDLLMPVMDGFQLLSQIKANDALCRIPIIVTSQGDMSAEESALELGADDFISKPYSPQIVSHRVHNVIEAHRTQTAREQELVKTKEHEQVLMDSIPGGVATYHLKKDGRIAVEYVSDGLARLCGYTTDAFMEAFGADVRPLLLAEDLPRLLAAAKTGAEFHRPIHEIQHVRTRDERILTVRIDASLAGADAVEPDDEAVLYTVHTKVSDDAESLMLEQLRYRYILDNLDVAYFELEADGTLYASDKYSLYAMSGIKTSSLLNDSGTYSTVYPEDLPILFDFFSQKKRGLPKASATLRLRMRDGSYRWTEILGFFEHDAQGRIENIIGVLQDVDSEWQNRNRRLQEALSAAEQADKIKTDFLARVSHEMRTPLNGILGIAELLSEKTAGADIRKDVEELRQSGRYLLELINDSLDVSTIEKGKMQLNPTVCDGKTAFQNMISMVQPSIEEKSLQLRMKADNLPFTMLYMDVGRVEQAVMNVLSNAIKFTPDGGSIDFIMENISNRDGIITDRILVRDNGIGIGESFLPHIFEPFAQEHADNRSLYSGAGLGMTIAKQCIELMGGTIAVESERNRGTTVTIVLPMPIATKEQLDAWHDEQEQEDLNALRGKRVLLCEDHPLNARIAIRLLEKKGLQVDHAENGRVGLDLFAASGEGYYAAVLMDIRMPVMDGLEATRAIRRLQRKDARCVPIIAMTANALPSDVKNALNAGMTEHLGKPVEPIHLYRTLAKLITSPAPFAGRKVLVVDDIEMNRSVMHKAIQDTYTVLEAASGRDALDILLKNPDIVAVVTDIQMPEMDGTELIRRIRADSRFDSTAILANTIYGDHRQEDALLALGANDFVYKPTSPQVIQMRLEHILRTLE